MNLQELKRKSPTELLAFAEAHKVENANSLRTQDMMFAILKQLAEDNVEITGVGVLLAGFGITLALTIAYYKDLVQSNDTTSYKFSLDIVVMVIAILQILGILMLISR